MYEHAFLYTNGIIHYGLVFVWLLSVSIVTLRFIHEFVCINPPLLFIAE